MADEKKLSFSISEALNLGFDKAKSNFFYFFVLFLILISVYILFVIIQFSLTSIVGKNYAAVSWIINWILGSVVALGIINITLKVLDGKKPAYKEIFFTNWRLLFVYIVASFLRQVVVIVGFICLIIPGIILSIKLQYIEYLIVDKKMEFESINKSWEMTKGVKLKLFWLGLVLGLINVAGLLMIVVGLFITIPLSMLANVYVYRKLLSQIS